MKKRFKVWIGVLLAGSALVLLFLLAAVCINALLLQENEHIVQFAPRDEPPIEEAYVDALPQLYSEALRIPTVSTQVGAFDHERLSAFHDFLQKKFPVLFKTSFITVEKVNNYSLLFSVSGSDPLLAPYMLTAHMDVVPVVKAEWERDPFGGERAFDPTLGEEVIWGRGAIDDKVGVVGILSALNHLVLAGWKPTRTFYVGLGHDEEVTGKYGAAKISRLLQERGVRLEFLLDEGLVVLTESVKGLEHPIALIGVSEKGYLTTQLTVEGSGGHSSMPPNDQAVQRLSRAISRLLDNPQPSMFGLGPEKLMLVHVAPKTRWPYKAIYANVWLFQPLIEAIMSRSPETNALIRTSTAVTIVRAGDKENVVPSSASATVNHRIHPRQTVDDVIIHAQAAIADPLVKISVLHQFDPLPLSDFGPSAVGYNLIASAIRAVYPEAVVAPSLMVANTDSRWYANLTSDIYRFLPVLLSKAEVRTIHGRNERLRVSNLKKAVEFYHKIIFTTDKDLSLKSA